VHGDQQRPAADAVDDDPGQRREDRRRREREEDEACRCVAASEGLRPDGEHDDHRPVAELRCSPAREEDARVVNAQQVAHQLPTCSTATGPASATSGPSTAAASSTTGWGISLTPRTGENSTGRKGRKQPMPLTINVVLTPILLARTPPMIAPSGMVPQTMKRMTEFMRPCSRSGVIACRRLTCVTL